MDSNVTVAFVSSRTEADIVVGLLESNGVRAFVLADDAGGQEPQWQLSGGVRVLVAAADADLARQVIDDAAEDARQ